MAETGGEAKTSSGAPAAPDLPDASAGTPTVFISYASQDAAVADTVVGALERAGLKCWIAPRDVVPGALYADEIVRAINEAQVVVLILSEQAVASPHVSKEIERASSKRRRIVALRTDAVSLPRAFEYFLSESQWIDVGSGGVEAAAAKLVEAVRRHIDPSQTVESPVPSAKPPSPRAAAVPRARWLLVTSVAAATLALIYLVVDHIWLSKPAAIGTVAETASHATRGAAAALSALSADKSIAVLPFLDLSEKHDQEYFSDGLSEELIDRLSHSNDLKVISRTSSFYFKGKQATVGEIASTLQVNHVLEGSVRKAGDALRITAQLIRVSDGSHVWSQTYERTLSDIFKVQDEIAGTVAAAMKVALTEPRRVATAPANTEAYNLLLQGNHFLERHTRQDTEKAVAYYQEAIALNPDYAPAWGRLAAANLHQAANGWILISEGITRARNALQRAIQIDPNFAKAHMLLGDLYEDFDWDWRAAQAEYARALDLDPTNAKAGLGIASLRLFKGQFDEWIDLSRQLIARDPLDAGLQGLLAWMLFDAGRLEESVATSRKLLELNLSRASTRAILAFALLAMGNSAEALDASLNEPDEAWRLSVLPIVYWAMGRRAESDQTLHQLEERYAPGSAYNIAEMHAYRGEADAAFRWLDRAYQQHDPGMPMSRIDPLLRNLHRDPRYQALLVKMKLTG